MPALPAAAAAIAAQAFRYMELSPLSSFADDTPQAQAASEQYPIALKMVLEHCDWGFASTLANLPLVDDPAAVVDPDLPYLYQLPAGLLVLREVGDAWTKWRRDGDYLRADDPAPLPIRYTGTVTDENRLPAGVQTTVACQLAALLAPKFLSTASKLDVIERRGAGLLKAAMRDHARDASSNRYDGLADQPDWVSAARNPGWCR